MSYPFNPAGLIVDLERQFHPTGSPSDHNLHWLSLLARSVLKHQVTVLAFLDKVAW
jgi:hypothetical protein